MRIETSAKLHRRTLLPRRNRPFTALAGLIGNILESCDFAVYGYFASDIESQFFPKSSASAQQLLAFAVFAIGDCARGRESVTRNGR